VEVRVANKIDGKVAPVPVQILIDEPESDKLRTIGGSRSDKFNNAVINSAVNTGWFPPGQSIEDRTRQIFVTVTGLRAFKPTDEIEAMLAAQAMAAHHASMECSRRAMHPDQSFEVAQGFRKAAANASRTFIELLSALDRKRGKGGQQVVRVEHVHVHPGGKAIVGNVGLAGRGGGGAEETVEEPHGSPAALEHHAPLGAVLPAMRSKNPEYDRLPIPRDAERTLPTARRPQHRSADS
jgi:hypothetical protein